MIRISTKLLTQIISPSLSEFLSIQNYSNFTSSRFICAEIIAFIELEVDGKIVFKVRKSRIFNTSFIASMAQQPYGTYKHVNDR